VKGGNKIQCVVREKFMKKMDYVSGGVLFLFALLLFFQARTLTIWGEFGPSSGFFPLILALLLGLLSLAIIIRAWLQNHSIEKIKILGPKKEKLFLYLSLFFAFGLFLKPIGYFLMLVAFLAFILKFVEKQSWKTTLGIIAISAAVSYFLFVNFLSVPLPEGPLSLLFVPK
jgi:hypothetical protein